MLKIVTLTLLEVPDMKRLFVLFWLFALLCNAAPSLAAQSTADVSVSEKVKTTLLQEIMKARTGQSSHEKEYIIGYGDILSVNIFEEGDMTISTTSGGGQRQDKGDAPRLASAGATVMMDGRISLREIGDVEVVGLTLTELADYLKKLYSTIYDNPVLTTSLVQSNSLRYTVMGSVAQPGIFFLDYPITVVQTVARSGGFSEWAKKDITVVRSQIKEEDKALFEGNTLKLDYDEFISGKELNKNILIRSGDIVIIN